jgi:hypothetical protein
MKTLGSLACSLLLASVTASFAAGCGCDPGNNSVRTPVAFTPSSVDAVRTPATCGASSATFGASDTLSLELLGETDIAPPYTLVKVDVSGAVAPNQAIPLNVSATDSQTTASSNDGFIHFSLATGSNPGELDANPVTSVVVTVTSLPTIDGQPLGAELYVMFADGRVLDQVYNAPVQSVVTACH